MNTEFLSDDELEQLCGFSRSSKQVAWLAANGYPYVVSAAGRPVVARMYVRKKLGVGEDYDVDEPNLEAVK